MGRDRFGAGSANYARFRPNYPVVLLRWLCEHIAAVKAPVGAPVVDVGAGTGIFTRQLAASLGADIPISAVEPSEKMRAEARREDHPTSILYCDGTAEQIPVAPLTARAITAATAAHWFDRPRFYAEAARILVPDGLLAIVEYVRAADISPAAKAVDAFLEEYGETRTYARPDYSAELSRLANFSYLGEQAKLVWMKLNSEEFVGLALSSSHARAAVAAIGRDNAERALLSAVKGVRDNEGLVPFGYRFQLFTSAKR